MTSALATSQLLQGCLDLKFFNNGPHYGVFVDKVWAKMGQQLSEKGSLHRTCEDCDEDRNPE